MVTSAPLSSHKKRGARGGTTSSCKCEVELTYLAFQPAQNFKAPMVEEYAMTPACIVSTKLTHVPLQLYSNCYVTA